MENSLANRSAARVGVLESRLSFFIYTGYIVWYSKRTYKIIVHCRCTPSSHDNGDDGMEMELAIVPSPRDWVRLGPPLRVSSSGAW